MCGRNANKKADTNTGQEWKQAKLPEFGHSPTTESPAAAPPNPEAQGVVQNDSQATQPTTGSENLAEASNPQAAQAQPTPQTELLRKAHEAKQAGASTMEIWGSGTPRREFLHVDDCADD